MPRKLFRRLMPDPGWIREHHLLTRLGPALHHPRLWHVSRHGIALGAAIGAFLGLLIPLGQMPIAAFAAVTLRANLPMALAGTWITNPFTFAPLYYLAYRIGLLLTGAGPTTKSTMPFDIEIHGVREWLHIWSSHLVSMGKPLFIGLLFLACVASLASYFGIQWLWRTYTLRAWRRRAATGRLPVAEP